MNTRIKTYTVTVLSGAQEFWNICDECKPAAMELAEFVEEGAEAVQCERCQASVKAMSLELGDFALVVANIDGSSQATAQLSSKKLSGQRTRFIGTREQLLGVLWAIEAAPAFYSNECDAIEASSLKRTSARWRRLLGLKPGEKITAPAWAKEAPNG